MNVIAELNDEARSIAKTLTEKFDHSMNSLVECGKIWVEAIDKDPRLIEKIKLHCPRIAPNTFNLFEKVGRGMLNVNLLMEGIQNPKIHGAVRRLAPSTQERVFAKQIYELLLPSGDILNVTLFDCTEQQVEQLCNGAEIRSLAAQKAWLEERKAKAVETIDKELPYRALKGKGIYVSKGRTLIPWSEVKRLLEKR